MNMSTQLYRLTAFAFMAMSSAVGAQVNTYAPNLDTGRFVSPEATPEQKSWAPYDTSIRPEINRSSQTYYPPRFIDGQAQGTPENRINAPIPYIFSPISPSGSFLLR
jgi:hypothetical protein